MTDPTFTTRDDLLDEAYELLAEYNCVLSVTSRTVTRAKVRNWLERVKAAHSHLEGE